MAHASTPGGCLLPVGSARSSSNYQQGTCLLHDHIGCLVTFNIRQGCLDMKKGGPLWIISFGQQDVTDSGMEHCL